jgi:transposase
MIGHNTPQPALFQMIDLESLVPQGHRLRQIDAALDLSFVREAVAECYTPSRGRPSIDPELAIRMMLLGVLYDLSDRRLCDEISMHAGFRWFCRLNFHDPVPDHSTLSRLRNERWSESDLFTRLFEEVLRRAVEAGMVSGRHVSIDGTQIQANASMQSLERREAPGEAEDDADSGGPAGVSAKSS